MKVVILGLSITSSWGNGHATTFRGLVRSLAARGHDVLFLERSAPWYAQNCDLPQPPWGRTFIYDSFSELTGRFRDELGAADAVMLGSFVPDGAELARWLLRHTQGVKIFYDIDTPITLAKLARHETEYISRDVIPEFDLYLSFTGGPVLELLEQVYGARRARSLYCSADPLMYYPEERDCAWDLGYLGTYSPDRHEAMDRLLLEPALLSPAERMIVAGPLYPPEIRWPSNVRRVTHLAPSEHRAFYCSQRFTLNLTRGEMRRLGYSPSVRLFEAAACGTAIISDEWPGIDSFFEPGKDILVARSASEVLAYLSEISDEERTMIGRNARERVLSAHTAEHRAAELELYIRECQGTVLSPKENQHLPERLALAD
jgi:spore maturation protein CgeB